VVLLSRLIAALAYAGAAFMFGVSLGERGELGAVQHIFMAVIPLTTLLLARHGRLPVLLTGAAMLAGLFLGQSQFERAWRDCVANGERVRIALLATDGEYPNRLEELPIALPCRCGFRKTILHYMSTDRSFLLVMTNDRETWVAAPKRPFTNVSSRAKSRAALR